MPTPNPRDESAERRFNWTENLKQSFREELEKLVILDYIMRNTDRGLDNWMIKIDWGTEQVSIVADPPKSTEPPPKYDEDDLMPPPRPVSVNSNGSNPYRRRETMLAVSRTGTPLASSEQQTSVQVGAIDNSLSWPWKHPDAVCLFYRNIVSSILTCRSVAEFPLRLAFPTRFLDWTTFLAKDSRPLSSFAYVDCMVEWDADGIAPSLLPGRRFQRKHVCSANCCYEGPGLECGRDLKAFGPRSS